LSNRAKSGIGSDGSQADCTPAKPRSRREIGKDERRRRIIQAAREMIRETGSTGLSMRALAARAGLSLATPYNLFGSRGAIILAVLEDVREYQARFARFRGADPIEQIFAAVDMAVEYYLADPPFYKTLWREVFAASGEVRTALYNPQRAAFWQHMVDEASTNRAIRAEVNPKLLLHHLDYQFRSVMLDWVAGDLPPEALGPTIRLGYALILAGAANEEAREPLIARTLECQARLNAAERTSAPPIRSD
jgi:AcrR family transcriptional regulator